MPFVVVLGAGVVGLSTALTLQEEKGYEVQIVAELLPEDPKSIRYTSNWAGAHHVSFAGSDVRQQREQLKGIRLGSEPSTLTFINLEEMDRETFNTMWDMSKPGSETEHCFMRLPQIEYYQEKRAGVNSLEVMPNFRYLSQKELIPQAAQGVSFDTLTIDIPVYLPYLSSRFRSKGGKITRASVHHISQLAGGAYTEGHRPDTIVVCSGLGSRFLGGVEDRDVFPIRGQTVLLRAPWVKFGRTLSNSGTGLWTYIIPRRSGDVIVGGSKVDGDWEPSARSEETEDILRRAIALAPELSPKHAQDQKHVSTVEDLRGIIISENCGLRPARKGGIRLETGEVSSVKGTIPVVYNYGHGGYGVQSSWGSARMAADLVAQALANSGSTIAKL